MKTHCRCKGCRRRRTLPKNPGDYRMRKKCPRCKKSHFSESNSCLECGFTGMMTTPRCRSCGSREYSIDQYRTDGKDARPTCYSKQCAPYPHRMGSMNLLPAHGEIHCLFRHDGSYREEHELVLQ